MAPRRALTTEEKEEKNRKLREKRAQEDPQTKAKRLEENRERAKHVREEKKRKLDKENSNREEAERKKRLRRSQSTVDREARLQVEAEQRRKRRDEEKENEKQTRREQQSLRKRTLRADESEKERRTRQAQDNERHQVLRAKQTGEERIEVAIADRLRHQLYLNEESLEEAEVRREVNREQTKTYRETENEEEMEERREENRIRNEHLREEREENEELMRAMDAFEHAEMIPLETDEERSYREKILEERNRAGVPRTHRAACKKIESEANVPIHDCGEMNLICEECGAKHFKGERPQDKKFQQCCKKGRVILPLPKECPEPLSKLLQNNHPKAKSFMSKIRNYNSAHAFASMGATISSPPGRGPYCFRIHGQVYHNTAAVGATPNPKYADLYFMDAAQASSYRANVEANGGCCRDLMEELDVMLRENNPYAAIYKRMRQVLEEEYIQAQAENRPHQFVGMIISSDRKNLDQRQYNSPTTNEIAVIFKSVNGEPPGDRDIRGHLLIPSRGRKFVQINPQKPMCDPMTYPLLFPNGEDGWHSNMPYTTTTRRERERKLQPWMLTKVTSSKMTKVNLIPRKKLKVTMTMIPID